MVFVPVTGYLLGIVVFKPSQVSLITETYILYLSTSTFDEFYVGFEFDTNKKHRILASVYCGFTGVYFSISGTIGQLWFRLVSCWVVWLVILFWATEEPNHPTVKAHTGTSL